MSDGLNLLSIGSIVNESVQRKVSHSGVSVRKPVKKKKKLMYNFKAISTAILRAKTSSGARRAVTKAKQKLGELLRKLNTAECDEAELRSAILHVKQMERIARKKKAHLEQEEEIVRSSKKEASNKAAENLQNSMEEAWEEPEESTSSEETLQQLMDLQREMAELEKEMWEDAMQEMDLSQTGRKWNPQELEQLKKKHRSEEWADIVKADMAYLRDKFERMERERQNAGSAVSLELHGQPQPVMVAEAAVADASAVDVEA